MAPRGLLFGGRRYGSPLLLLGLVVSPLRVESIFKVLVVVVDCGYLSMTSDMYVFEPEIKALRGFPDHFILLKLPM